ncbi:hypothetical protein GUJ93_ZPchr0003g17533 [Zizania palustris]|uniref:Cupin type-1 domain-containing protein n=1 Tax=Zizania palustris TaxID=103762 RepID=A0A8J5V7Q2_ZIZPA|nr:hypothetical protein GUJ93_ZPchr0003g17533 [Zizania palustris]
MVQRTCIAEAMLMDLSPKLPVKAYSSDGGAYYDCSPADLPMLSAASIGAAKLSLFAGGLALPSYSDSAKVTYVLQGKGTCGLLPEATAEKLIPVKEGDVLALPFGVLTGSTGIFTGFSTDTEFVARAWDLPQDAASTLVSTQPGVGIVKIKDGHRMTDPSDKDREGMKFITDKVNPAPLDVDIKNGGRVVVLNTQNLPLVKEVGLGADLVRIDDHSMCSPGFSCDSAYQVTYIVRGSGRVQVVGIDGTRVLETRAEGGCLFIVPRFFVVSKIADDTGMEWFSIITRGGNIPGGAGDPPGTRPYGAGDVFNFHPRVHRVGGPA